MLGAFGVMGAYRRLNERRERTPHGQDALSIFRSHGSSHLVPNLADIGYNVGGAFL
jgi:hypothetical protein